jgi:hypothetical protein
MLENGLRQRSGAGTTGGSAISASTTSAETATTEGGLRSVVTEYAESTSVWCTTRALPAAQHFATTTVPYLIRELANIAAAVGTNMYRGLEAAAGFSAAGLHAVRMWRLGPPNVLDERTNPYHAEPARPDSSSEQADASHAELARFGSVKEFYESKIWKLIKSPLQLEEINKESIRARVSEDDEGVHTIELFIRNTTLSDHEGFIHRINHILAIHGFHENAVTVTYHGAREYMPEGAIPASSSATVEQTAAAPATVTAGDGSEEMSTTTVLAELGSAQDAEIRELTIRIPGVVVDVALTTSNDIGQEIPVDVTAAIVGESAFVVDGSH